MSDSPKRRRFRKLLLLVLTAEAIGGCWLGSQIRWARDREAFFARTWVTDETPRGVTRPEPPGILEILGAKGVQHLCVSTKDEIPLAQALFPEAKISQHIIFTVPTGRTVPMGR